MLVENHGLFSRIDSASYSIIQLKNVFVENHGLLSRINIVPYSINQPLKLCWIQKQMNGADTIVQYASLNDIPYHS
jgi:hypothetical protein